MTTLTVFDLSKGFSPVSQTTDTREIIKALVPFDVRFARWQATRELPPGAGQDEVLQAYAADVDRLKKIGGYQSADVVRMRPDHPDREAMRQKFLSEHTHADDEVRFFVEGAGAFYLRNKEQVLQIVCTAGDLLSVPKHTRHWFDMGPKPLFAAIRLFTTPEGWVAEFTGDKIADNIPKYAA
ncbi:MAG: 1,2-dihydroxy-3-keto-5-methylthiopentene dioxygenase [Alphaproteobacteria bacterium]